MRTVEKVAVAAAAAILISAAGYWSVQIGAVMEQLQRAEEAENAAKERAEKAAREKAQQGQAAPVAPDPA